MTVNPKPIAALWLAAATAVAAADAVEPRAAARPGEPAPSFTLPDLEGKPHRLSDYRGKVVVIEWTNPRCPFVELCYKEGVVAETLRRMKALDEDSVYLTINSSADIPRDEVTKGGAAFLERHKLPAIPMLVDYDGRVGRSYDARTTPHMFVIDKAGVLRYHGRYTDDPTSRSAKRNFVLDALTQMRAAETVAPAYVQPWGCSVKYAKEATERAGDATGGSPASRRR